VNSYNDTGREIFFRIPANANWFNFTLSFTVASSSSTSNPMGIALIPPSAYPYPGSAVISEFTSTGSPIWTSGTNTYCGSILPGYIDSILQALSPGDYSIWFVFNDTSVQVAATISFMWSSVGPSNVLLLDYDGDA